MNEQERQDKKDDLLYRKTVTGDYIVPIYEAAKNGGKYSQAYSTGFKTIDDALVVKSDEGKGGVRDGDVVVVTGLSGSGKTTLCQNFAYQFDQQALPSLFFSYEVSINNLYAKFKDMGFTDDGVVFVPLKIITGNLNWVREKIVEAKEKYYTKMVFIDHLGFLSPSEQRTTGDQLRIILTNMVRQLKRIAVEEEVIIFLMAHTKKVHGREIEMQDIGESSGIYQEADLAMAISRQYEEEGGVSVATNQGIIKVLKNRLTGEMPYFRFVMRDNKIYEIV